MRLRAALVQSKAKSMRDSSFDLKWFVLFWHGAIARRGRPQSALFPINDLRVIFEKMPPSGICPSNLLKERFKSARYVRLAKEFGMAPERTLEERSNSSTLSNLPSESAFQHQWVWNHSKSSATDQAQEVSEEATKFLVPAFGKFSQEIKLMLNPPKEVVGIKIKQLEHCEVAKGAGDGT
ncbi:hypothetical protein EJB05_17335 [Eragrostis curvula]|uniref:Uncharacterized protein n=1 Tax=Eragrostis curvula TaxID=38414 RepID=A0A5J9VHS7_9POAL|nr:hypothetical protein EJB05_17335 [Eragrostis curvula]